MEIKHHKNPYTSGEKKGSHKHAEKTNYSYLRGRKGSDTACALSIKETFRIVDPENRWFRKEKKNNKGSGKRYIRRRNGLSKRVGGKGSVGVYAREETKHI